MDQDLDVVVIGAGPAGYVAAIRCAQLGLKVACVDDWLGLDEAPTLGGTCLNVGCIPSKALLHSSALYYQARTEFARHGIQTGGLGVDVAGMQAHKEQVVRELTDGIKSLFRHHGVHWLPGRGQLIENVRVAYWRHGQEEPEILDPNQVILAGGSRPIGLDAAPLDGDRVVDSSGALALREVPRRLGIIGAGIIGLELGSVWNRLGSEVVLLEAQEQFLTMVDEQIARAALKTFGEQGLDIRLGARVLATEVREDGVLVRYHHQNGDHEMLVDRLVVAVGRRAHSEGLASPEAELVLDERGAVVVDEYCATNIPDVYAIGDLVRGPMLAHKGSEEGIAVAETIASGHPRAVNPQTIPSAVYTEPEIAWVGETEAALKARGVPIVTGSFPFAASGRARAMGDTAGLAKIIAHAETDQMLGVHIFGNNASELIAEAVLAMEYSASSEDLARTIHAHPTLSEALHEAALAVDGRAIHVAGRSRRG